MRLNKSKTNSTSRGFSGPPTPKALFSPVTASKSRYQSKAYQDSKHPTKTICLILKTPKDSNPLQLGSLRHNSTILPKISLPKIFHLRTTRQQDTTLKDILLAIYHLRTVRSCRQDTDTDRLKDSLYHLVTFASGYQRCAAWACVSIKMASWLSP